MDLNADIGNTCACTDAKSKEEEVSSPQRLELNLNNSQSENKSKKQKQRERQHRKGTRNAKRKANALEKLGESQSNPRAFVSTYIGENESLDPQEETEIDENKQGVPSFDNNTAHSDDVFGTLSIYIDSSIHCDVYKGAAMKTNVDDGGDFGYVYFSMSEFLK